MCLLCPNMVFAQEANQNVESITISEYDMYKENALKSASQLQKEGYSSQEINILKSISFEELLLERAQLSEHDLKVYGYTDEQIKLLKEYDGSLITPDSLIVYAISDLSINVATSGASARSVTLRCTWQWSSRPLFNYKDAAAMVWKASDAAGHRISTDITSSVCMVAYQNTVTGNLALNKNTGTVINEVSEFLYSTFEMTEILSGDNNWGWAKSGRLDVTLVPQGNNNFSSISVVAGYGHAKLTGSIGVSASSTSLSLSFTPASRVDTETVSRTYYI